MFRALNRLWARSSNRVPAQRRARRLTLESLEDRRLLTGFFVQNNLVSDIPGLAALTDSNLSNPWGIAFNPGGPIWIANNNSGTSTVYNNLGQSQPPTSISVPPPAGSPAGTMGTPDGIVFNGTANFRVSQNSQSGAATFLFATEDGTIAGWNQGVNPTSAVIAVDNSAVPSAANGAVYKGLALGNNAQGNFLFATNFRSGAIDVFNSTFAKTTLAGSFTDPNLPAGFAPFGIQNIGGQLFVTYAKQDGPKHDPVSGAGNGFVDVFDTQGNFVRRLASQGTLNAPWGVAMAPASFGAFGGDILVGNFRDGRISVFTTTGTFVAQLQDAAGNPITLDGLWALEFGGGGGAGDPNTLFVTAGLNHETQGLFATLGPSTQDQRFIAQAYLDLLHRPADQNGMAFFSGLLANGMTRTQIISTLEGSLEYRNVVVQGLYNKFLHRGADPTGQSAFTNFLGNGGTIEQVEALIAGSDEYFQVRGGATNDGFLATLYQDALGRPIDPTGQTAFSAQLASGVSRNQVATAIFGSGEFQQDLIQGFYQSLLHRAPDSSGLAFFLTAFKNGATDQLVTAVIVGSDEYFSKV